MNPPELNKDLSRDTKKNLTFTNVRKCSHIFALLAFFIPGRPQYLLIYKTKIERVRMLFENSHVRRRLIIHVDVTRDAAYNSMNDSQ